MNDELANDFYTLVGVIAGHDLPLSEAQTCELGALIIDAGFRLGERP